LIRAGVTSSAQEVASFTHPDPSELEQSASEDQQVIPSAEQAASEAQRQGALLH
jgi:hypothetical protein